MRSDQMVGLSEWASKFVEGEMVLSYVEQATRTFPNGKVEVVDAREVYSSTVIKSQSSRRFVGMYEGEHILHNYTFPDGKVYEEHVQASPWSSGPVIFLALRDEKGDWVPESLWSQEDIDNA